MTVKELQYQLKEIKCTSTSNSVAAALVPFQKELTKHPTVFDPYRPLSGFGSLVDLGGDNAETRTTRFSTILHLSLGNSQFQNILVKLVGDKDIEIAKAIQKYLCPSISPWPYISCSRHNPPHCSPNFEYHPRSTKPSCLSWMFLSLQEMCSYFTVALMLLVPYFTARDTPWKPWKIISKQEFRFKTFSEGQRIHFEWQQCKGRMILTSNKAIEKSSICYWKSSDILFISNVLSVLC